jgi:hypothetical protein
MNELGYALEFGVAGKAFLDEILHRLDVMIGGGFDILDAAGVNLAEFREDFLQLAVGLGGERGDLLYLGMSGKTLQPAYLYDHAPLDQSKLAENLA